MKDGVPYVTLKKGETSVVRLINDSRGEAGVSLSIDGINPFPFQDGKPGPKVAPMNDRTVAAGTSGDVPGWSIDASKFEKFELTEAPSEIAALTIQGDSSAVGRAPPPDEPRVQAAPGAKAPELGVKRGAPATFHAPPRMTIRGVIRDSITIRYQEPGASGL